MNDILLPLDHWDREKLSKLVSRENRSEREVLRDALREYYRRHIAARDARTPYDEELKK